MALIEIILEELTVQNSTSQSFAIKKLTALFLDCNFTGDNLNMRFHLQVLKQNHDLLEKLLDHKLQF